MISSRGQDILRTFHMFRKTPNQIHGRHSSTWNYRSGVKSHPRWVIPCAEIAGGYAWWWVLWHLWTEPGHIFGEFSYPDARLWTDEELGIPKD